MFVHDLASFEPAVQSTPHAPDAGAQAFADLTADVQAELHPSLEALRRILDRPQLHTIGDLAALTEQMTSEMMLFHALVGGPAAALALDDAAAPDVEIDFLAAFLRDLAD
jgi:hypothetical protein